MEDIALFIDNGATLCLHLKKKKGSRNGRETMAVTVISIGKDHIMASPQNNPKRILSIDLGTNVSRLKTASASLIY